VDDASGAFVAWGALSAIKDLNLRPKRTIRAVFWNGEENTGAGADAYYTNHVNLDNETHIIALEYV
jgi:carboxypeptidase Q